MKRINLSALLVAGLAFGALPAIAATPRDLAAEAAAAAQHVRASEPLIRELAAMGAIDQEIRFRFLALRKDATPAERAKLDEIWSRDYAPFDQRNTARLKEMLAGRGWFTPSEVGHRTSDAAFHIVQHSGDLPLMKSVLEKMQSLRGTDEFGGQEYAMLYDRVATMEHRPQRYGTQGTDCDGTRYVRPADLEDPDGVDRRRAEMGLQPMAEYLAVLQKMYGACAPPKLH